MGTVVLQSRGNCGAMRILLLGFLVVACFCYGQSREINSLKESDSDSTNDSTEEVYVEATISTDNDSTSQPDHEQSESDYQAEYKELPESDELMKEIEDSHEALDDQDDEDSEDEDYDPDDRENMDQPGADRDYRAAMSHYEMMMMMNFFPRHWGNYPAHRQYNHPAAPLFFYPPPQTRYLQAMQDSRSNKHRLSRRSAFHSFLKKRIEVKDSDEWWQDIDGGEPNAVTDWFRANMPNFGASEALRTQMHHFAPAIHIGEISTGYEENPHIGKPSDRSFGSHFDFNEHDLETFAYRPTSERFSSVKQLVEQVDHGTFPHGKKYILDHFITHKTKCWQYDGYDKSQHVLDQFPHHFWRIDCHKVYKGVYKLFGYTKVDSVHPVHPVDHHHKSHKVNFILFFRTIDKHQKFQSLFAIKHPNSFGIRPESLLITEGKVFSDPLHFKSASIGHVSTPNPKSPKPPAKKQSAAQLAAKAAAQQAAAVKAVVKAVAQQVAADVARKKADDKATEALAAAQVADAASGTKQEAELQAAAKAAAKAAEKAKAKADAQEEAADRAKNAALAAAGARIG